MNLGAHVSIAKSIDLAIDRGVSLGSSSIQIFPGPPQTWLVPKYPVEKINLFKQKRIKNQIKDVFIHAIYLINLASPNDVIWNKSYQNLLSSVKLCETLEADGVIFHPGSFTSSTRKKGLDKIVKAINQIYSDFPSAKIIFENSTSAGNKIGNTFDDLNYLLYHCPKANVCLDTCHLYASGYDFSTPDKISLLTEEINSRFGINKLKVIHLNGSLSPFKSNVDRHADIGEGELPLEWMINLVNHNDYKNKPFILETPQLKKYISEIGISEIKIEDKLVKQIELKLKI